MIADCRNGKIDRIITKSISRLTRNNIDCLNYDRELKVLGISIIFEKEELIHWRAAERYCLKFEKSTVEQVLIMEYYN